MTVQQLLRNRLDNISSERRMERENAVLERRQRCLSRDWDRRGRVAEYWQNQKNIEAVRVLHHGDKGVETCQFEFMTFKGIPCFFSDEEAYTNGMAEVFGVAWAQYYAWKGGYDTVYYLHGS